MDKIRWQNLCDLYDHILHHSCLCSYTKYDINKWISEFISNYRSDDCQNSDYDTTLLFFSTLHTIAKKYIVCASSCSSVCLKLEEIKTFIHKYWSFLVDALHTSKDKFLNLSLLKGLSVWFYTFDEKLAKAKMQDIFSKVKMQSSNCDFIHHIIMYNNTSHHFHSKALLDDWQLYCVECVKTNLIHINDVKLTAITSMSENWNVFIEEVFKIENSSGDKNTILTKVLPLWKSINEEIVRDCPKELYESFLNSIHISHLFLSTGELQVTNIKMFLDIVIQILSIEGNEDLDKLLSICSTLEFLNCLPTLEKHSFFGIVESKQQENGDTILIKIGILIICKLLNRVKSEDMIFSTLCDIQKFLKKRNLLSPNECWIVHFFLDDDSLLVEAMLSTLKLYKLLKFNTSVHLEVKNMLNPHNVILQFLKTTGMDYHILLDFLTSNETCILSYLMLYMKFAIANWNEFVETHEKLNHPEDTNVARTTSKVVSYSSSSESEEEEMNLETFSVKKTVSVFSNLRLAIARLSEVKQFPYNAGPLMDQIQLFENKI